MVAIRTTHLPLKQAGPYFVKFLHDRLVAIPMNFETCAGKIRRDVANPSHPPLAHVPPPAPDLYIQRAAMEANAFNSMPSGTPVLMSFSGLAVNFRACYNGFSIDLGSGFHEKCRFALERGFGMTYNIKPPGGWASATDGSGDTSQCTGQGVSGCRVTDRPIETARWTLRIHLDGDYDGDGVLDSDDALPTDPGEWDDTDGDGDSNLEEFRAGTDPQDADDFPLPRTAPVSIFILLDDEG